MARFADEMCEVCDHGPFRPCPRCGEYTCLSCEDWQRYHSLRGWLERHWWSLISQLRLRFRA